MQTTHETASKFIEVAYQKHGTHAYAVGYFSSMVSAMIYEMRQRGGYDMADYYDRQLRTSITNILTEK